MRPFDRLRDRFSRFINKGTKIVIFDMVTSFCDELIFMLQSKEECQE